MDAPSDPTCHITVLVRVRPLTPAEEAAGHTIVWEHNDTTIWQSQPSNGRMSVPHNAYAFDRVYGAADSTRLIHEERVRPVVERVLHGYNAAILAYGETSSGKTTTIRGARSSDGLIALCLSQLLEAVSRDAEPHRWSLWLSYLEIYNESVNDLLSDSNNLQMYEGKDGTLSVVDLTEVPVGDWPTAEAVLIQGDTRRHISSTVHNERSSRAHTVCRLSVGRRATAAEPTAFVSELSIVDLAGSERICPHGPSPTNAAARGKEGGYINRSLLVLSNVIHTLSAASTSALRSAPSLTSSASSSMSPSASASASGASGRAAKVVAAVPHVSYRSSKITRLLQNSLSGAGLTLIVCNVTPARIHAEESHNTLRFAQRAKHVVAVPVRNAALDPAAKCAQYEDEIVRLKRQLAEALAAAPSPRSPPGSGGRGEEKEGDKGTPSTPSRSVEAAPSMMSPLATALVARSSARLGEEAEGLHERLERANERAAGAEARCAELEADLREARERQADEAADVELRLLRRACERAEGRVAELAQELASERGSREREATNRVNAYAAEDVALAHAAALEEASREAVSQRDAARADADAAKADADAAQAEAAEARRAERLAAGRVAALEATLSGSLIRLADRRASAGLEGKIMGALEMPRQRGGGLNGAAGASAAPTGCAGLLHRVGCCLPPPTRRPPMQLS